MSDVKIVLYLEKKNGESVLIPETDYVYSVTPNGVINAKYLKTLEAGDQLIWNTFYEVNVASMNGTPDDDATR